MIRSDKYKIFRIPAEQIHPNPAQPRENFDTEKLSELAESIRQNGLLQPVTVRENGNGEYEIIAGERRFRAAKEVGYSTIPCIISQCSENESAALAIIENIQRCDLDCFEEASAIKAWMTSSGITQENAAKYLGKSQSSIANKLRLLKLSDEEKDIIRKYGLTERHARALLRLNGKDERIAALYEISAKRLNVEQTEKFIESFSFSETEKKKQSRRKIILKDIRIFLNTIDHAVETLCDSGVNAAVSKNETDQYIECVIRIPKTK